MGTERERRARSDQCREIGRLDPAYPAALARFLGEGAPASVAARGEVGLLGQPTLALFCSQRCPGSVIVPLYALVQELGEAGVAVVGGFHTAVERDCLDLLLRAGGPVIACPAREIAGWRVPAEWRAALEAGRLLVLSPFAGAEARRPTAALAGERNRFVAALAEGVLVAHAAPGGRTAGLVAEIGGWGKRLLTVGSGENRGLVEMGARVVGPGEWRGVIGW